MFTTLTPAATATILRGALALDVRRGRAVLSLMVRCPHCRGLHVHSWGFDPLEPPRTFPAAATHRVAHCWRADSPFREGGYFVLPDDTAANRRILEAFLEARRRE